MEAIAEMEEKKKATKSFLSPKSPKFKKPSIPVASSTPKQSKTQETTSSSSSERSSSSSSYISSQSLDSEPTQIPETQFDMEGNGNIQRNIIFIFSSNSAMHIIFLLK